MMRIGLGVLVVSVGLGALACATGENQALAKTAPGAISLVEGERGADLFRLEAGSAPLLGAGFLFWGANWGWQGTEVRRDGDKREVRVDGLGLRAEGARTASGTRIRYRLPFRATRPTDAATGGALVFNLNLGSPARKGATAPPTLDGADGFRWEAQPGKEVRVRFEPPVARLGFEPNNPAEIRAWIYADRIPEGARDFSVVVDLPAGGGVAPSLDERYGPADTDRWLEGALAPEAAFVDLSFLNAPEAPAGKRGFVQAKGDGLVFADGTPARFWGANVQAYSLFTQDRGRIDRQVKRLSALGFNLVRLHHHDSARWVQPSLIADGPTSQKLNEESLDTYFYWIAKLKEAGVYVFLDLHTGRPFRKGDDIPGFEDLAKAGDAQGAEGKGFTHVNARLQALMRAFARELLTRRNPYTGLALKDDPAVMGILLTNENDVTAHFGNAMLGDKGVPYHHDLFTRAARDFAQRSGLPFDAVMQTWLAGPSKYFLNDLEHRFSREWIADLRKLGVRVPIVAGHQWGGNPLFSLPALMAGDVLDAHAYEQGEWIDGNPRFRANFIHWLAAAQAEGRPFVITEYNTEDAANARDPFTVPLYVAAVGRLQGWDAPMLYGYSQDGINLGPGGMWSAYTHPGVMGTMPAAAMMFRRGDVAQAKQTVRLALDPKTLFETDVSPTNSLALRTAPERHRLVIAMPKSDRLPWLASTAGGPANQTVTDPAQDLLGTQGDAIASDTGEIRRDFAKGIQTIDTPRSQAAQGWIGGEEVRLGFATVRSSTRKATVAFTSLDGKPLASSERILVSAVARVARVGNAYRSEPVEAELVLSAPTRLRLFPLGPDGKPGSSRPAAGGRNFRLGTDDRTHWYLLQP